MVKYKPSTILSKKEIDFAQRELCLDVDLPFIDKKGYTDDEKNLLRFSSMNIFSNYAHIQRRVGDTYARHVSEAIEICDDIFGKKKIPMQLLLLIQNHDAQEDDKTINKLIKEYLLVPDYYVNQKKKLKSEIMGKRREYDDLFINIFFHYIDNNVSTKKQELFKDEILKLVKNTNNITRHSEINSYRSFIWDLFIPSEVFSNSYLTLNLHDIIFCGIAKGVDRIQNTTDYKKRYTNKQKQRLLKYINHYLKKGDETDKLLFKQYSQLIEKMRPEVFVGRDFTPSENLKLGFRNAIYINSLNANLLNIYSKEIYNGDLTDKINPEYLNIIFKIKERLLDEWSEQNTYLVSEIENDIPKKYSDLINQKIYRNIKLGEYDALTAPKYTIQSLKLYDFNIFDEDKKKDYLQGLSQGMFSNLDELDLRFGDYSELLDTTETGKLFMYSCARDLEILIDLFRSTDVRTYDNGTRLNGVRYNDYENNIFFTIQGLDRGILPLVSNKQPS